MSKDQTIEAGCQIDKSAKNEFTFEKPIELQKLHEWIRVHQWNFLNALSAYGDLIGTGRKFFWQLGSFRSSNPRFQINQVRELDVFTGSGFCALTSAVMFQAIKQNFSPETVLRIMSRTTTVPNLYSVTDSDEDYEKISEFKIKHVHLHFLGEDGKTYFIDPTYGQINKRINRVVIDLESKEDGYYGEENPHDPSEEEITSSCLYVFDQPDYLHFRSSVSAKKYEEIKKAYGDVYHSLDITPPEDNETIEYLDQQKTRGEAA